MGYCKSCGRKIGLGYTYCYDCNQRRKNRGGVEAFFGGGGHKHNNPRDDGPRVVIVKTPQDVENERREQVRKNRVLVKVFALWVIPFLILYLSINWFFDKNTLFISNGYLGLGISILWLAFSFYLRKRRGKWV
jgi:hypothetical protein